MEDLYHAHEQLWTYTFEPCLNKVGEVFNNIMWFILVVALDHRDQTSTGPGRDHQQIPPGTNSVW